jgi:hypothetical protein
LLKLPVGVGDTASGTVTPQNLPTRLKELVTSGVAPLGSDAPATADKGSTLLRDLQTAIGKGPPQGPTTSQTASGVG